MKNKLFITLISVHALWVNLGAASDLDNKLDALRVPSDKVTPLLSQEDLVSVTGRYSSLTKRTELSLKGAYDFSSDSHIETKQIGLSLRRHINSKWSVGLGYNEFENILSPAGKKLFNDQRILPDTDYAIKSVDGFLNYNTVYGKLRLTQKRILYFDHYIAAGYGHIDLASGQVQQYTLDTGMSFWFGKHASLRLGVKSAFFREKKIQESQNKRNSMGYLEVGFLL